MSLFIGREKRLVKFLKILKPESQLKLESLSRERKKIKNLIKKINLNSLIFIKIKIQMFNKIFSNKINLKIKLNPIIE